MVNLKIWNERLEFCMTAMYIRLILASPFERILNPSTTIRCEPVAEEDAPPKEKHPHHPGRG
jgi:hypothetical protein